MSYFVICPSCNERNSGSAFRCVKCDANLIGVPRQETPPTEAELAIQQKTAKQKEVSNMESKKTPTDSASKSYRKVRSPGQIAGIAFGVTIVIGVILVAGLSLIGVSSGVSSSLAKTYDTVTSGTCPAAIVVALVAYFWAKSRDGK